MEESKEFHSASSSHKTLEIGQKLFEMRDYTPIPLILILFMSAEPSVFSATLGTLVLVAGEIFRIYTVGFIGTVSRTRSGSLGQKLVTNGPFAYVRNPLYLGNFLIVSGFGIYSGHLWFLFLTWTLFAAQYHFVVKYEESLLKARFGMEYEQYQRDVPAWFPSSFPKISEFDSAQEIEPALRSEKRTLTSIVALLVILQIV